MEHISVVFAYFVPRMILLLDVGPFLTVWYFLFFILSKYYTQTIFVVYFIQGQSVIWITRYEYFALSTIVCHFIPFCHCIVCPSSNDDFWSLIRYLHTFIRVIYKQVIINISKSETTEKFEDTQDTVSDWNFPVFFQGLLINSLLIYLSLLAHSGVQHILFLFCLSSSVLAVSLDYPFLISPSAFSNVYLI